MVDRKTISLRKSVWKRLADLKGKRSYDEYINELIKEHEAKLQGDIPKMIPNKNKLVQFYKDKIQTKGVWSVEELTEEYNELYDTYIVNSTMRKYLNYLADMKYIIIKMNMDDKRKNIYSPIKYVK